MKEYVLFKLADEYYGINILNVETIEKEMPMTRVPYAKNYVKGVVNLRGNVVPVIDLRKRMNLPELEYGDETRIIIVKLEDVIVGIVVDSSSEVIQLNDDQIDDAPNLTGQMEETFIECIGKSNDNIIMLIDLYRLLEISDVEKDIS